MVIQFLMSNGSLGVMANDQLIFSYLCCSYLFVIANLIACSIFSQILGKSKNVIEYMSIFLSLFVIVPIFACIKPDADDRQLAFERYAVFIPSVAYL